MAMINAYFVCRYVINIVCQYVNDILEYVINIVCQYVNDILEYVINIVCQYVIIKIIE
jgi:hypothetical protein